MSKEPDWREALESKIDAIYSSGYSTGFDDGTLAMARGIQELIEDVLQTSNRNLNEMPDESEKYVQFILENSCRIKYSELKCEYNELKRNYDILKERYEQIKSKTQGRTKETTREANCGWDESSEAVN